MNGLEYEDFDKSFNAMLINSVGIDYCVEPGCSVEHLVRSLHLFNFIRCALSVLWELKKQIDVK